MSLNRDGCHLDDLISIFLVSLGKYGIQPGVKQQDFVVIIAQVFQDYLFNLKRALLGIEVAVESGQLTALIVKGSGKANLEITMEWGK